jgi:iron complex transport system substrate-binding protein
MKRVVVLLGLLGLLGALAQTCPGQTVKHALGETCVVGTPKRVVTLEWTYTEFVLALGMQPVGVADIKNYNEWVHIPPKLAAGVVDVGTRQQPTLEIISQLKPDLIIAPSFRSAQIYQRLSSIAPTIALNPYPTDGSSHLEEMRNSFTLVGQLLGRSREATRVLQQMDTAFARAKLQLEQTRRRGETFILAQAFTSNNVGTVRLFTRNSQAGEIFERIGLRNAWPAGSQQFGFSTVSLEGLVALSTTNFFYVVQPDDVVFSAPSVAPLWNNLSFVKAGRAYPLGARTWLFGGPLSAQTLVEAILKAMTAH